MKVLVLYAHGSAEALELRNIDKPRRESFALEKETTR